MKQLLYSTLLVITSIPCLAQNIGMGTLNPDPSAQVEISSNQRGLLIPRMDSTTVAGIKTPAKGLMVYDTARNQLLVNMGTAAKPQWKNLIEGSGWSLTGNLLDSTRDQFIGTLGHQPISLRINGISAGVVDDTLGYVSLGAGTPGFNPKKLFVHDPSFTGITAVGYKALASIDKSVAGESYNSAFGNSALTANIGGSFNTAIGCYSMIKNVAGRWNTAVGMNSLPELIQGDENVAIGYRSLSSTTTGGLNTGIGNDALDGNLTGIKNTAIGAVALSSTTASDLNVAVGFRAGSQFNNSHDNVFIGALADASRAGLINVVAIGEGATCTSNSQVRIGNTQTASIGGFVNWTNFSDGRFKKNMKDDVKGLDFIMRLRPITYTLDMDGIEASLRHGKQEPVSEGRLALKAARAATITTGFVAQEVEKAASDANYDFSGVDKPRNDSDFYGLRYAEFVAPMVKAIQEQQKIIEKQSRLIEDLTNRVRSLEKK